MINLVIVTARSASFELNTNDVYYAKNRFDVFLNDKLVLENQDRNVFSIYNLTPKTDYVLRVNETEITFTTLFESATVKVKDFGALGDGINDDTFAIQAAIQACPASGRVLFEPGIYKTRPLFLKDDIMIEIPKDVTILGETNRDLYPILPAQIQTENGLIELSSWEGKPNPTYASIITGLLVKNVIIYGQGIVDENAQNGEWWLNHKEMYKGAYRAKGVFLSNCENVTLQGITVMNTPSWNLHPYFSKDLKFIDLKLISPKDSPNTDGCNPESCDGVDIIGVDFSVGDDCIAIKSGKFEMGMKYARPSENITIRNCLMAYGHGGVVLGSEMSGGIRNLNVTKCLFKETDRGLRIKTRRGRGKNAIIDGVIFDNIIMQDVLAPLVINMYYFCDEDGKTEYVYSKEKHPVDDRTPYLGKFVFKNIECRNVHQALGYFYGLPEQPIESITLENITVDYAKNSEAGFPAMMSYIEKMKDFGIFARFVNEITLKNVKMDVDVKNSFEDYRNLNIEG